jgi:hypothetical protein
MHHIYASAVCNFAASWAEDCTKSMFSQRLDSSKLAHIIQIRYKMSREKIRLVDTSIWPRCVEDSPLRNRGWVFQERFLSPRKIHFSKDQILWECSELQASENWPLGFWPSRLSLPPEQIETPRRYPPALELSQTQIDAFKKWGDIVKTYSQTNLTKDTDRLVALPGVAGAFAASQGYEASAYVAGMWRHTLELSMFWALNESGEQLSSRHYIAPSFSWASQLRGTSLAWDEHGRRVPYPYFRTSNVHLTYGSADRFGILLEGSHLIVTGPVWTVRGHFFTSPDGICIGRVMLQVGKHKESKAKIYLDHHAWSESNQDIFCISGGDQIYPGNKSYVQAWFPTVLILLRPVPELGTGAFRRVGLATYLQNHAANYDFSISLAFSENNPPDIPSVEYRPKTGEHVIKIF